MKVILNGKEVCTKSTSLKQLKKEHQYSGEIVILNGYQTDEDLPVSHGDHIAIIEKGKMPDEQELESMMAARHTPMVHQKVKTGSVAIAGLGGLGSNVAAMLARTGVGRLLLVDFDVVEPSNLNRQNYEVSHLGLTKAEAAKRVLQNINPFIRVESAACRVTPENIKKLFSGYDVVCEAFDRADQKAMLVNGVLAELPEAKIVAASGMAGYGSSNAIRTSRKMKKLYVCGDMESGAEPGMGLMAPRVNICAGHQANMILRLLLGLDSE